MGYRREIAAKNRKFAFDPKQSAVRAGRASLFVRSFLQPGEIDVEHAAKPGRRFEAQAADGDLCVSHHHRRGDAICRSSHCWNLGTNGVDLPSDKRPTRSAVEVRCVVVETPFTRNVDRRKFINGRWTTTGGDSGLHSIEIASILVQARPEQLDAVARAVEALPGTSSIGTPAR